MRDPLTFVDLFAGAGGFSLGLYEGGLRGLFAIERDPMAFSTLRYNLIEKEKAFDWPEWLPKEHFDIRLFLNRYKRKILNLRGLVDLVVGGPPCQGFSTAGRRIEHDERNSLFQDYVRFVKLVEPRAILFENVPGFAFSFRRDVSQETYSAKLSDALVSIGYERPMQEVFDFSDYGVPQARKRLVVCATQRGEDPLRILENVRLRRSSTKLGVADAISDLRRIHGEVDSPDSRGFKAGLYGKAESPFQVEMRKKFNCGMPDSHRFANHASQIEQRFWEILNAGNWSRSWTRDYTRSLGLKKRDLKALDPQSPSPTLTTLPDDLIHYSEPRILTVREYSRIQTFPDWYEFKGKYTTGGRARVHEVPRYSQIANAVPPYFASLIGSGINL